MASALVHRGRRAMCLWLALVAGALRCLWWALMTGCLEKWESHPEEKDGNAHEDDR